MELDPKTTETPIPPPELDVEAYRDELASLGMTAEQEDKLLATLWDIMRTMVDIGYGMDAVQMVVPSLLTQDFGDAGLAGNIPVNKRFNHHAEISDKSKID
ncbi:MAG: hypothetical protein COA45_05860 [Zetaproteobacteria bacterium]|nr:MAG: hypothetical protein COA45_05860 [Zetaproteobacteria bacterium]